MANLILKFGEIIFKILFIPILIICGLLLLIFPILPVLFYRKLVIILQPFCRSDLDKILYPTSAIWKANVFGSSSSPGNFMFTAKIKGKLNFSAITEKIRQVFLQRKGKDEGKFLYPEFQMNLTQWYGFWFWKPIKDFRFENYVLTNTIQSSHELSSYEMEFLKQEFNAESSPWQMICLEIEELNGDAEPHWFLLFKNHHALADGFGIFNVLMQCTQNFDNYEVKVENNTRGSYVKKFWKILTMMILIPLDIADKVFESLTQNPNNNSCEWSLKWKDATMERMAAKSNLISYDQLKKISIEKNVHFSAVLFALVTGGVRNTLKKWSHPHPQGSIPDSLDILIPISASSQTNRPKGLKNHFMMRKIRLPIGLENSKERLNECQLDLAKNTNEAFSYLEFTFQHIFGCFPWNWLIPPMDQMEPIQITSFPGPKHEIKLNGGDSILDLDFNVYWNGISALLLCILSYNGGIRIVANGEKSIFPTQQTLQDLLNEMEQELIQLQN